MQTGTVYVNLAFATGIEVHNNISWGLRGVRRRGDVTSGELLSQRWLGVTRGGRRVKRIEIWVDVIYGWPHSTIEVSNNFDYFSKEKCAKFTVIQTTLDTMCAKQFSVRSSQCCPVLSSALNSMYMGGRCAQCTPAQVQARPSTHSDSFLRVQF